MLISKPALFVCSILVIVSYCQAPVKTDFRPIAPPFEPAFIQGKSADIREQAVFEMAIYHLRNDYLEPLTDYGLLKLWLKAASTQKNWPDLKYKEVSGVLTLQCRARSTMVTPGEYKFENFWPIYDEFVAPCAARKDPDFKVAYEILKAMTSGLHEGTKFLDPADFTEMNTEIRGNFGGVGLEFALRNEKIVVVEVIENGPAVRAGLQKGDIIETISQKNVQSLKLVDVLKLLRGKPGTEITISVRRSNAEQPLFFSMIREVVKVPSVKKMPGNKQVMHLLVKQLNYQALTEMREYLTADSRPLLLDLRSCPGGLLESSHQFAEIFLPTGAKILSVRGRKKELERSFTASHKTPDLKRHIVVLTDAKTAGGCEIIAAALRHHGRAKIIGTPTFGRGTIQNIVTMAYSTALVLTIQEIILPDGSSLLQKPIQPDIIVTADKDALEAALQLTGS